MSNFIYFRWKIAQSSILSAIDWKEYRLNKGDQKYKNLGLSWTDI